VSRNRRLKLSLSGQRRLMGVLFTMPFIIGFVLFFLYPFIQSLIFSTCELKVTRSGFELTPVGLENYTYAVGVDPWFRRHFVSTMVRTLTDVPVIVIFSTFAASLLNQQFKGRTLARVVFFLPVILSANVVMSLARWDYMQSAAASAIDSVFVEQGIFSAAQTLGNLLRELKIPVGFTNFILAAIDRIPQVVSASGIQILIILAALQSIPSSLYEVSMIEGATAWESFWKITFPMISPLLLTAAVYTIIDSFTSPYNDLVNYIETTVWSGGGYGVSAAMSWIYFAAIAVVVGLFIGLVSTRLFYER